MVLCLKTWESRSLPGLRRAESSPCDDMICDDMIIVSALAFCRGVFVYNPSAVVWFAQVLLHIFQQVDAASASSCLLQKMLRNYFHKMVALPRRAAT